MAHVFIGGAWPYANGSLHLGRLASLLPGDVLARYYRAKGDEVLYVSGSDCHGTPVAVQAAREGVAPGDIADRYHREFVDCFERLGFTYDLYTRTDQPFHHQVVQELFGQLLNNGYLYKKTVWQTYCETDRQFLPDRYVEGVCPACGQRARGDQCDHCSTLLDPSDLTDKTCKLCGLPPAVRPTEHYYLALSRFQAKLDEYVRKAKGWRDNAVRLSRRYLEEGLQDRAATRDLSWGVEVPAAGFEGKKIYVWIEAVSGYLSASKQWAAAETGGSWEPFWSEGPGETIAYYVHGKDNIPFHTLIWPAVLLGASADASADAEAGVSAGAGADSGAGASARAGAGIGDGVSSGAGTDAGVGAGAHAGASASSGTDAGVDTGAGAGKLRLPDRIVSGEYLTLEGKKFSTSRNWAVWVPDLLARYDPDSIRYFLIANGPEKRDADFSWREFIHSHNGELLGAFGNFVNRTLAFIGKSFNGCVPDGSLEEEWRLRLAGLYAQAGQLIEDGSLKEALELLFSFVRGANKYFDEQKPWAQLKEDRQACGRTLHNCVQLIANLAQLLNPFLPFSCEKTRGFLDLGQPAWRLVSVPADRPLREVRLLFERIDLGRIDEETGRLAKQAAETVAEPGAETEAKTEAKAETETKAETRAEAETEAATKKQRPRQGRK